MANLEGTMLAQYRVADAAVVGNVVKIQDYAWWACQGIRFSNGLLALHAGEGLLDNCG